MTTCKNKYHSLLILPLLLLSCLSCGMVDDFQEVARQSSLDGVVDAVMFRAGGGGATSGFSYSLFVVKKGSGIDKSNDVLLQADHLTNMRLAWKSDRILEISYDEARIFKFKNFWQSKDVQNFQYVVELKLAPNHGGHALSRRVRFLEGFDMSGRIIPSDSSRDSIPLDTLNGGIK